MKHKYTKRQDLINMYYMILDYTPFRRGKLRVIPRGLLSDIQDVTLHHPRRKVPAPHDNYKNPLMVVHPPVQMDATELPTQWVEVNYVTNEGLLVWTGLFNWTKKTWKRWEYFNWSPCRSVAKPHKHTKWNSPTGHNIKARLTHDGYGMSLFGKSEVFVLAYDGINPIDATMRMALVQTANPYNPPVGSAVLDSIGCCCEVIAPAVPARGLIAQMKQTRYAPLPLRCMWDNHHGGMDKRMTLAPVDFVYQSGDEAHMEGRSRARLVALASVEAQWRLPRFSASHPRRNSDTFNDPMQEVFYLENTLHADYGVSADDYLTADTKLALACEELDRLTGRHNRPSAKMFRLVRAAVIDALEGVIEEQVRQLKEKFAHNHEVVSALSSFYTTE